MKWTTRSASGKVTVKYVDSGVKHNPPPTTERGKRRAERKAAQRQK